MRDITFLVLKLLDQGKSTAEIAAELCIHDRSVRRCYSELVRKGMATKIYFDGTHLYTGKVYRTTLVGRKYLSDAFSEAVRGACGQALCETGRQDG